MEANKGLTKQEIIDKHKSVEVKQSSFGRVSYYNFEYLNLTSAGLAMEEYASEWKAKYDELKAEYIDLGRRFNTVNETLISQSLQHQQLKERAQRLADALKEVQTMAKQGIFPHLPIETKGAQMCIEIDKYVAERLSEYNQSKGGKEGKV